MCTITNDDLDLCAGPGFTQENWYFSTQMLQGKMYFRRKQLLPELKPAKIVLIFPFSLLHYHCKDQIA